MREMNKIYLCHFEMTPKVELDNRQLRYFIIESLREQLQQEIGLFIVTG